MHRLIASHPVGIARSMQDMSAFNGRAIDAAGARKEAA
jgi:hypothetical protein